MTQPPSKTHLYITAKAIREGQQLEVTPNFDFETERLNRTPRFIEIVTAYQSGHPVATIVEKHKCSRNTVLRYARLAGLPKRPKHFNTAIRSEAIELLRSGAPLAEIATMLDVSKAYVSTVAKESGLSRYKTKS